MDKTHIRISFKQHKGKTVEGYNHIRQQFVSYDLKKHLIKQRTHAATHAHTNEKCTHNPNAQ